MVSDCLTLQSLVKLSQNIEINKTKQTQLSIVHRDFTLSNITCGCVWVAHVLGFAPWRSELTNWSSGQTVTYDWLHAWKVIEALEVNWRLFV